MNNSKPHQILYKLVQGLHEHGGATVSTTGEILTAGISVGIRPELEHTFPAWGVFTDMRRILGWLQKLPNLEANEALGIWKDPEGLIYLDVVNVYDIDQAMVVAAMYSQRSIYHLERGELIWI